MNLGIIKDECLAGAWKLVYDLSLSKIEAFQIGDKDYGSLGLHFVVKSMPLSHSKSVDLGLGFTLVLYTSKFREVGLLLCGWRFNERSDEIIFQESIKKSINSLIIGWN